MRIVGGTARGIRLKSTRARWLRPTTDRARTVLFDWLGERIVGARVLDLFCGTGALGLEALSRGAQEAVFVDQRREALELTAENLRNARLEDRATLVRSDALRFVQRAVKKGERFDVILADPPYGRVDLLGRLVEGVAAILDPDGILVLEHSARHQVPERAGKLKAAQRRKVGDAQFTVYAMEGTTVAS